MRYFRFMIVLAVLLLIVLFSGMSAQQTFGFGTAAVAVIALPEIPPPRRVRTMINKIVASLKAGSIFKHSSFGSHLAFT